MSKYKEMTHDEVIEACKKYMNDEQLAFVEKAYKFAFKAHHDQKRASGQPYIVHPTQVAGTLATLSLDPDTIAAGFLHDTVEDTPVTNEDIKNNFGKDVAFIVDGVTKLNKYEYKSHQEFLAENHRKMLIAMAKDLRVIMVKLADRLHNMHTLEHLRPDKQRRIASETMDIYAPLADRLGIGTIKWELEDMSFHYLNPKAYYQIVNLMDAKRSEREGYINDAINTLKASLESLGIKYEIHGRPKHIYSIYKKMVDKHKDFNEIYDLLAVRVIVPTVKDCYAVLGAVHTKWKPMPGRFKDYIAVPKVNGYQSLHTTIIGPGGRPLEIQIRTKQMHEVAEYGVAAHWAYKQGNFSGVTPTSSNEKLDMVREILELKDETQDADEFMKSVKSEIFSDRVYAFTPKGEVYELPKGSVTLDFAYEIHTQVGSHAVGAKVNGKLVPLDYKLKNGDVIEIMTQSNASPSRDWIDMVKTSRARNKIRRYYRNLDRDHSIEQGEQMIISQLREQDLTPKEFMDKDHLDKIIEQLNYHTTDEMYAAVGFGDLSAVSIVNRLTADMRHEDEKKKQKQLEEEILNSGQKSTVDTKSVKNDSSTMKVKHKDGVMIQGISDLMQHLAKCCNPVPGDEIVGYVTKGRGVTIHRKDCRNIVNSDSNQGRLIEVEWENVDESSTQTFNAEIEIFGYNRSQLLSDVLNKLNSVTSNINNLSGKVNEENIAHIYTTVAVNNSGQLEGILAKLRDIPDVYQTRRADN
ncbi:MULTISPECIES: bifunctional (p)ppGpp synthetase/guanosine-3',5'-bis(diphosphate) 3'-pyrophosphohydrolase [unclassified Lactobacillus]|uniref:RelA/SpoT family protein n=1 Tax=unclassified Lactobacillus TaxID=2620435 RepID=UPI000EFD1F02|nr:MULTISPECIES: bifunctional (p)ppGpp synthetase/guanosine-3',5'-bis(diphosphate) 3'-pyrophosphohydrolase [unclassified Lactobacillus]RMC24373.1 bifunctional (p)ppGpp synthetase/guanosine-3',5'-bis(diphosphate) 3'-pyrophosphohydrolase [Lactobacillus sp. ESL0247]RMC28512.1 bifunctional (p)ppGpp synthetase/guanosine-3',5'-bis(diphosphate) 3'-pyrophosphohydrolase [Lactobacillus sp. ESL0246]RMC31703.1 bifunctional (p)ppGpp synthetase/guanosine-3',5'-bis(diphosphate) 3'-pyrophosphohydrolase [Lactoba